VGFQGLHSEFTHSGEKIVDAPYYFFFFFWLSTSLSIVMAGAKVFVKDTHKVTPKITEENAPKNDFGVF
jgi:hypothetical protein